MLISFSLGTNAWSGDSHRVIAAIAHKFLSDKGRAYIAEHLCEGDEATVLKKLIDVSVYPDTVEWSDELHFSNTPLHECSPFVMDRDCGKDGRCIVSAIGNYTARASDRELSMEDRAEAIKFIVHLVADIHNPMHVAFEEDRGGNFIHLSHPDGASLHNVWDYVLVNRLQHLHGVFRENSDDGVDDGRDPWELSNALISQLGDGTSGVQHVAYKLQVEADDFANLEAATTLAARMASWTAEKFTCAVAYRDHENEWIQSGDGLDEKYLRSRTELAKELLKFAGVRLAQFINNIARLVQRRVFEQNEAGKGLNVFPKKAASMDPPVDRNRFLALDFDFDPEEYIFDESAKTCIDRVDDEKPEVGKDESHKTDVVPAKSEGVKISKTKKKKMRKAQAKRVFEGVDLESVVLIKRCGSYIVTGAHLVTPDYFPYAHERYQVRFTGSNDVTFLFDNGFFGIKGLSAAMIARSLMKIRNLPFDGITDSLESYLSQDKNQLVSSEPGENLKGLDCKDSAAVPCLSFEKVNPTMARFDGEINIGNQIIFSSLGEGVFRAQLREAIAARAAVPPLSKAEQKKARQALRKAEEDWKAVLGYVPSKEELAQKRVLQNMDNICYIEMGLLLLFLHKSTLADKSIPMVEGILRRVIVVDRDNRQHEKFLIVDGLILDGDVTETISSLLKDARQRNTKTCTAFFPKRASLLDEMRDLIRFLVGSDAKRAANITRIKYLHIYIGDGEPFHRIQWSIRPESADLAIL